MCLHIHSWYKLRIRNILIYHIHNVRVHTHTHRYRHILRRIFLDTLKIGISEQQFFIALAKWAESWRSWGTVKIKMEIEERRLSSLRLSVPCFVFILAVVLRFYYLPNIDKQRQQQLTSSGSLPHSRSPSLFSLVSHVRVYINLCA